MFVDDQDGDDDYDDVNGEDIIDGVNCDNKNVGDAGHRDDGVDDAMQANYYIADFSV